MSFPPTGLFRALARPWFEPLVQGPLAPGAVEPVAASHALDPVGDEHTPIVPLDTEGHGYYQAAIALGAVFDALQAAGRSPQPPSERLKSFARASTDPLARLRALFVGTLAGTALSVGVPRALAHAIATPGPHAPSLTAAGLRLNPALGILAEVGGSSEEAIAESLDHACHAPTGLAAVLVEYAARALAYAQDARSEHHAQAYATHSRILWAIQDVEHRAALFDNLSARLAQQHALLHAQEPGD